LQRRFENKFSNSIAIEEAVIMAELNVAAGPFMDVNELTDDQAMQRSSIVFLVVAILAMIGDGFDLAAVGYVVPELVKQWGVAPKAFTVALTAGVIGLFIGGPLLGHVGDRIGRKKAIIIGLCIYGLLTLATTMVGSLNQLVVLRFLTGIGLGGMIPNVLALAAEVAPKRLRGRFAVIVLFGVPAGLALPGLVTAVLVPQYGWPVLLLIGGLLPLAIALVAQFTLPESLKFLMQKSGRDSQVTEMARALRPDIAVNAKTRFTTKAPAEAVGGGSSPVQLFRSGLALITPTLWIALATNQFANFFTITWLPTLLQSAGLSTAEAGVTASMFSLGGFAGGVLFTFLIDKLGVVPIVGFFILGIPLIASVGIPNLPPELIGAVIAGAGFCVYGNQFGINAALVMIYPTPVRAIGAGWAQAFGRIGSIAAPIIGGALLGMSVSTRELFFAPGAALVLGAIAAGILAMLCFQRFAGCRLDETAAAAPKGAINLESSVSTKRQFIAGN
jgi:MFS transporter, AAHS family, 4-hydroxybenzoate transporter